MFLRFLTGNAEAYSTEPLKNENEELALGFYHMQNVRELNGHIIRFLEGTVLHRVQGSLREAGVQGSLRGGRGTGST